MASYAFLLDITRCIGCQACVVACKTGNELPTGMQYIRISERTTGTFPKLTGWIDNHRCFHCTNAPCVDACPVDALYKEDGMTRLDRSICIGCGDCVTACPYEVPEMVDGLAAKCDGCAAVVKAGGTPWCVKTCPSNALLYGEREEILAEAKRRQAAVEERYPNAGVFGETQQGGLGLIMVLPDSARRMRITAKPSEPAAVAVQHQALPPAQLGLGSWTIALGGLAAVIGRRNLLGHLRRSASSTRESAPPRPDDAQE